MRLVIAKRDLGKHRNSERHRYSVARSKLERQSSASAGTDMPPSPTSDQDDDQAFVHDTGDLDSLPHTSNSMDEDTIISIGSDAPVKLPEASQDYYDEYRAAVLQGENLFEVRLPPYKEPDDVGFDHRDDGDFIQYV